MYMRNESCANAQNAQNAHHVFFCFLRGKEVSLILENMKNERKRDQNLQRY